MYTRCYEIAPMMCEGSSARAADFTLVALYGKQLAGGWRRVYVITAVTALYFNFFVFIVQLFRRVPALTAAAPTQSEPPFGIAQGVALVLFIWLGVRAVKRFQPV